MGKWMEYEMSICSYLIFTAVMASTPTPTTSKHSIVLASPSSRMDEEDNIGYETDLSAEDTDTEINTDTSTWFTANRKKLQHMMELIWNINVSLEREPQSEL